MNDEILYIVMSLKKKDPSAPGGLRVAANDPHLVSLGGGRLSTAVTIHYIPIGSMTIGSSPNCSVSLNGSGVQPHHCTLYRSEDGEVTIIPENDARVLIDGNKITSETNLTQGAMLTIGNSNYLRFNNPAEAQMIKSTMGSNERISMPQIDFTQDHRQSDSNNSLNKGGILNNALKSLTKPYDTHINQNKSNNETILEKVANVEYININNFHSPKVFTADSITVNAPAKDVLGPKYANFAKNLAANHKNDKNFCTKSNEMNFNNNNSNKTGNIPSSNFIQNSPLSSSSSSSNLLNTTANNEILTKLNNSSNNAVCNCTPLPPRNHQQQQQIVSAAYDRYPKIGGGLQLFPMNGINSEINIDSEQQNNRSFEQPQYQQQNKTITAQEQERLDEILKICTEYERQQQNQCNNCNNSIQQSSPIVQNRIKTNGSLPRDKKSPFFDMNSQTSSAHSKTFFPTATAVTTTEKLKTTPSTSTSGNSSSGYENVRIIGDRRIEIGSSNFHHNKNSSGYENVIIGKYIPQSPRTKIRTTCTSPSQKKDVSLITSTSTTTVTASNHYNYRSNQSNNNTNSNNNQSTEYAHLIQSFEEKLKMEMQAIQECTKAKEKQAILSSSMMNTSTGHDSLRKRQNLNINNLTLNLNNSSSNHSNDHSLIKDIEVSDSETIKHIDDLKKDRENVLSKIRKLKTQIAEIQRQEDEVLRELDLEKALVSAEMSTVNVSLVEMEKGFKSLQSKIHRLEAQRNANRVMQETQQAKLKQSIEMKQEQVAALQKMLRNNESNESLKEEYEKNVESLENDRKTFEDLEFQYLEEETDWMAYRDELHTDLKNLTKEIEGKQLQMLHLQSQGIENQNSACTDTKTLENNLLTLLKELERSREELQAIDKTIYETTGEQRTQQQQNQSDSDDDEIDLRKNQSNCLNTYMSQSLFGSTEILSAKLKETTINLMSRSVNENMFFNNNIEMPTQNINSGPSTSTPKKELKVFEITENVDSNQCASDQKIVDEKNKDKKIEIIPGIVRREHNNDEKDPILKLKYNVKMQDDETQKVNLNLSLEGDDFEVNPLDKRLPSQDDIDRISKVTLDAPISTTKGASNKIIESIKEIERNRQLLLAQQGSHVIEHERQKMMELKKRCHDEARAQYLSSHSISQQNNSDNKPKSDDTSNDKEKNENKIIGGKNTPLITKLENLNNQQELEQKPSQQRHSHPELESQRSRPLSDVNTSHCEKIKERQFKSNNDLTSSTFAIATATNRLSGNSEDAKRSSLNSNNTLDDDRSCVQNNKRILPKHQRPLTRYLPIMSPDLDLRQHIESAGHQISLCPHVVIDSYSCRGYLHKLGATFHGWSRRWFVLDRKRNAFIYYSDRSERKPRGGAYFSTIDEVYLDHLNTSKSGRPHCTFIVKTKRRSYHLQAASDAAARIWIDAIITGAQGNIDY